MKFSILCIFTLGGVGSGITYTFRNVEIITYNETALVFKYKAMSDSLEKTATFFRSNIAGYSVTEETQKKPAKF